MVNDFWLKNKHTISIFQAQVRDLAKHIEAQPKKHNAYKKNVYPVRTRLQTLFKGTQITAEQNLWNKPISEVRISVELVFRGF